MDNAEANTPLRRPAEPVTVVRLYRPSRVPCPQA